MNRLRTVVIGQHEYLPYLLQELFAHEAVSVVGLVVRDDTETDLSDESDNLGVYSGKLSTPDARAFLNDQDADIGVCLGWYDVIDDEVLSTPAYGIIGLHAAPLPRGRGHAPVNWQIINQQETATISIFQLTEHIDAGDVYGTATVPIHDTETAPQLYDRLLFYGIRELFDVLTRFNEGETSGEEQNDGNATYWPARVPADGVIDWTFPAAKIVSLVRALAGRYPSAFTYHDGNKIDVNQATVVNPGVDKAPGTVEIADETKLVVHAGDDEGVELLRLGISDEPKLTGGEFATEQGLTSGDTVGADADFPSEYVYTALRGPDPRTNLRPVTNGEIGTQMTNSFYCHVPHGKRQLQLKLKVDGEVETEISTMARGHTTVPITYVPVSEQHYLEIESNLGEKKTTYLYATKESGA